ncbi:MAG: hypothetical protein DRR19_16810 [Candidatus Parabeggiatoa sp. nov. 1]|nr:MAG: hypothetical protein DRR19_16810 [Gammaproteobacteria bacterium]
MLINRTHKFLFIHIQRTGGSSLRKVLTEAFPDTKSFLGSHDHALWAKPHLDFEWPNYYKIAFVRNPWERMFSWYTMINKTQQGKMAVCCWETNILTLGVSDCSKTQTLHLCEYSFYDRYSVGWVTSFCCPPIEYRICSRFIQVISAIL